MATSSSPSSTSGKRALPVAVVTGSSRGIGAAAAQRLAADGFDVGVHYREDKRAAQSVVKKILQKGCSAFSFCADLNNADVGKSFWEAYDEAAPSSCGPLRVLVNNAGITLRGTIGEFSPAEFMRQQQVNTAAPFLITQAALPRMVDGGRIINVSSIATRIALPDIIGYAMSKGAIDAFTLNLAQYLGPRGITVNAVAPGLIDTDINADWLHENPEAETSAANLAALGRIGKVGDVADVVAFLASDAAGFITGQVIDVSGGARL